MIKIYTKEIDCCDKCPEYEYRDFENCGGGWIYWCKLFNKEIHPISKIPSWCELSDKQ